MFGNNFYTSHVSINRASARRSGSARSISIHLMFLLIHNLTDTMVWWDVFQYISCFY